MSAVMVRGGPVHGRTLAPPSKSYTHRALLAGFLTHRPYHVHHPNDGEDSLATREGLGALGASFEIRRNGWTILADDPGGGRGQRGPIQCRASGTTLRFLTALAATQEPAHRFRGSRELARRPMDGLIGALREGGARFEGPPTGRSLPFTVRGRLRPGSYRVPGGVSSQFVSALLFALPGLEAPSTVLVDGPLVSRPYLDATVAVLGAHHVRIDRRNGSIRVPAPQPFVGRQFFVPGDASSAAYLWAAAAVSGGEVRVGGVDERWPQADLLILDILRKMGAAVRRRDRGVTVSGPLTSGCDIDLTPAPDLFPLVAALATTLPGSRSVVRGAPQIALKESDRRAGARTLVTALGGRSLPSPDQLEIIAGPGSARPRVPAFSDHRMVMSAAVAALGGTRSLRIEDASAVRKSFPGFWEVLAGLGAHVEARP